MMKYYKIKLACDLKDGIYYHHRNKFKYKLEDVKKALEEPRLSEIRIVHGWNLLSLDNIDSMTTEQLTIWQFNDTCGIVKHINLDEGHAEVIAIDGTPKFQEFMNNLDCIALGFSLLTHANIDDPKDEDGYLMIDFASILNFHIVTDEGVGAKAEFIKEEVK